eukprot:168379-Prymnesium_polylepis.1
MSLGSLGWLSYFATKLQQAVCLTTFEAVVTVLQWCPACAQVELRRPPSALDEPLTARSRKISSSTNGNVADSIVKLKLEFGDT